MTANPTQGAGPFEGPAAIQCPYCAGSGSVGVYSDDGSPQQCGECQGEGLIGDRRAAPPPPVNASAIDAWKAAEEIHEAVVALSWARDGDFVPAVAAIILRHSAAPGLRLTGEERSNVENAKWWAKTNTDPSGNDIRRLLAIIDRLAPTGSTQEEK